MKILLYVAIGLILATFFVDHFQHGWFRAIGPGVTLGNLWTTVDLGTVLILASLACASANTATRFLRRGVRTQDGAEHPRPSENTSALVVVAKILLWSGIGLILLTFLIHLLHDGFLRVNKEVITTPSGKPRMMRMMIWTPVDLGCYLIVVYLAIALVKTTFRRRQDAE